jgi:hypothetical protein
LTGLSPFQNVWFAYSCPMAQDVPVNVLNDRFIDEGIRSAVSKVEESVDEATDSLEEELWRARLEVFRNAPTNLQELEEVIAQKAIKYDDGISFAERAARIAELEFLVALRDIIKASAATA